MNDVEFALVECNRRAGGIVPSRIGKERIGRVFDPCRIGDKAKRTARNRNRAQRFPDRERKRSFLNGHIECDSRIRNPLRVGSGLCHCPGTRPVLDCQHNG